MNATVPSDPRVLQEPVIKVCGITCTEDAQFALESGANMLGFVVANQSPRGITPDRVAEIVRDLPDPIPTVLVTVGETPDDLAAMASQAGISHVQLCGDERAEDFQGFPLPILKRIAVAPGARTEILNWTEIAEAFVLDHPSAPGGTGKGVDLKLAKELAAEFPCLLAGGLSGANVADAAQRVLPMGVDASSRLEKSPGIKNHDAVYRFVLNAQEALGGCP